MFLCNLQSAKCISTLWLDNKVIIIYRSSLSQLKNLNRLSLLFFIFSVFPLITVCSSFLMIWPINLACCVLVLKMVCFILVPKGHAKNSIKSPSSHIQQPSVTWDCLLQRRQTCTERRFPWKALLVSIFESTHGSTGHCPAWTPHSLFWSKALWDMACFSFGRVRHVRVNTCWPSTFRVGPRYDIVQCVDLFDKCVYYVSFTVETLNIVSRLELITVLCN